MEEEEGDGFMAGWTFKFVVEGILMTAVSLFGLLGNSFSIYILHNKEVKKKKYLVEELY